jgi:hypothetical protein
LSRIVAVADLPLEMYSLSAVLSTTPPESVGATQRLLLSGGASRERFPATFAVPVGPLKP